MYQFLRSIFQDWKMVEKVFSCGSRARIWFLHSGVIVSQNWVVENDNEEYERG